MFLSQKFAITRSTKALSDFATFTDSQPTPAWLKKPSASLGQILGISQFMYVGRELNIQIKGLTKNPTKIHSLAKLPSKAPDSL